MSRLRVIYRTREPHLAYMLQSLLGDYGIRANVVDVDAFGSIENSGRVPEVIVADADAETAAGIAALFEKHVVSSSSPSTGDEPSHDLHDLRSRSAVESGAVVDAGKIDAGEIDEIDHAWENWPLCPRCRQRRQTVCPVCETAGQDFKRGYLPPEVSVEAVAMGLTSTAFVGSEAFSLDTAALDTAQGIILLCGGCDEAFVPRFYNRCEHCGHNFGGGIQVDPRLLPENPSGAYWFGVALLVVSGMLLLLMAI